MTNFPDLLPGDCLLYFQNSVFDWLVALKTWNKVAHIEIYAGQGKSLASRNGKGVDIYPVRFPGLAMVRRPTIPLNWDKGMIWFYSTAKGQGYDWKGLLCFTLAVRQGSAKKMFCSEYGARQYRKFGLNICAPDYDADKIAPAQHLQTPSLDTVWKAPDLA